WVAHLYDGTVLIMSLAIKAGAPGPEDNTVDVFSALFTERSEAAVRDEYEVVPGLQVSGRYACDFQAQAALARRWKISAHPSILAALAWSSYLVGMELPGCAALFFRLTLDFHSAISRTGEMTYQASVRSFDDRTRQARMDVSITSGERRFASGECCAFCRP